MTPTCRVRNAFVNTFASAVEERSKRSYSNAATSSAKMTFPVKLYNIIETESSDIISWVNNGDAFKIINHTRFESEVIPKYFRHSHISSVQRQLNLYGFRCVTRGAGDDSKGLFFHPLFKRGGIDHVAQIRRSSVHANHEYPTPAESKNSCEDVSVFALHGSLYDSDHERMMIVDFENEISKNLSENSILEDMQEINIDKKPILDPYVPVNYTFKIRESMLANRLGYKNFAYAQQPDINQQKVLARSQLKRPLENVPIFDNFSFDDIPRFNEGFSDKMRKTKSFEDLLNFCAQLENIPTPPLDTAIPMAL